MAIKSFDQIESDIIDAILTANPTIDVKIGSVVRDVFVDAHMEEYRTLYSLADWGSRASSILFAKNNLLDLLAQNFNVFRKPAQRANVYVTLVINGSVTAPTPISLGDQFYTLPDNLGNTYTFICVTPTVIMPGQTQVTILCTALEPGAASNVPALSIKRSNYDFVDSVFNSLKADGGQDQETDSALAARVPLAITGQYVNTYRGILNVLQNVDNILNAPLFITPDNVNSRGAYAVDVYLQRNANYQGTPRTATVPANASTYVFDYQPLYELNPLLQVSYTNQSNGQEVVVPQYDANNNKQYDIVANPSDVLGMYKGSILSGQRLQWYNTAAIPDVPYSVTYNSDDTVIDSQNAYNAYNELTADILFKQAKAIPIYISGIAGIASGADTVSLYSSMDTTLVNLFDAQTVAQSLASNDVLYNLLSVPNLLTFALTNLDTTYEIVLKASTVNGKVTFSLPASAANSQITPFGFFYQTDVPAIGGFPIQIAAQLWVGNPDRVGSNGVDFSAPTDKFGVPDQNTINSVTPSWSTSVDTYFDKKTGTMIYNFDTLPPDANQTITLQLVQTNISTNSALAYLTLAPSIYLVPALLPQTAATSPVYVVAMPDGLDSKRAKLYKNGVALVPSSNGVAGDYQIAGPDSNGIYRIAFTVQPAQTDVLQFGLLNPDISFMVI